MKRVLENLRHLARPMPIERFPLDVNRAVTDILESMHAAAESAGVGLEAHLHDTPLVIDADAFALGRVFRNLVTNALQATAAEGQVVITTGITSGGEVEVRVADTGCGIPPERLGTIFDDFVTTKRRGLGLGLAISKKIVEQLGGTIAVASRVGEGTTFRLRFHVSAERPTESVAV
jgi:signal transduction histidine kinase